MTAVARHASGQVKLGRNDPCFCGSGKKYKQCCMQREQSTAAPVAQWLQEGLAHHQAGRLAQAEDLYRQILQVQPQHADALHLSGVLAYQRGDHAQAAAAYREALNIQPGHVDALSNLGVVLLEQGQAAAALPYFRQAIALKPDFFLAHNNLGNALKDLDQLDAAEKSYRTALALRVDYAEAWNNLGFVEQVQGRLEQAVAHYRQALALRPAFAEAYNNLGNACKDQCDLQNAIDNYRQAVACKPDYAEAHSNLLFCLNYHPDLSAEEIFAEYRRWDVLHAQPLLSRELTHANTRDPQRRLRIGYVSPDFRKHSARHFIEPMLAHHDKTQVEVFCYAQVLHEDDVSATFKTCADHWCNTVGMSDAALAEKIRNDGIDILVDLAGHTVGNRLRVFARKPAPIQISTIGCGYTTGLSAIDYCLADHAYAPPGSEHLFSEQPLRLPIWLAYRPAAGMGAPGPLPAAATGRITFGALTRSVRINHRVVRAWAEILKRVPTAQLIINSGNFRDTAMQARMRTQFAAHGIAGERLLLGFESPPWDVLRKIDITLDCFPHNSGITLFESAWLGVPFVTLADRPSVGRIGAVILEGIGRREWIADSEADYIDKTVALASDLDALAGIRARLRAEMQASPLMDEVSFTRSVEAAYRAVWEKWCFSHAAG
ncbi:MAG: tetratricopeptide repeat protein [Burkholderiaceae bacterium]|nr:MAG: tetratricopeptide repeat protein [Burkholderiaceae bacterium]